MRHDPRWRKQSAGKVGNDLLIDCRATMRILYSYNVGTGNETAEEVACLVSACVEFEFVTRGSAACCGSYGSVAFTKAVDVSLG